MAGATFVLPLNAFRTDVGGAVRQYVDGYAAPVIKAIKEGKDLAPFIDESQFTLGKQFRLNALGRTRALDVFAGSQIREARTPYEKALAIAMNAAGLAAYAAVAEYADQASKSSDAIEKAESGVWAAIRDQINAAYVGYAAQKFDDLQLKVSNWDYTLRALQSEFGNITLGPEGLPKLKLLLQKAQNQVDSLDVNPVAAKPFIQMLTARVGELGSGVQSSAEADNLVAQAESMALVALAAKIVALSRTNPGLATRLKVVYDRRKKAADAAKKATEEAQKKVQEAEQKALVTQMAMQKKLTEAEQAEIALKDAVAKTEALLKKNKTKLIIGGVAAAGLIAFLILRKRKA